MADEDFLRRLDDHLVVANAHMARGNEIMARSDEIMARSDEVWVETREALAEIRQSLQDMRVELRQTSLRGQRVAEQFAAEVRASREERRVEGPKTRAILDDLVAESRAGRDAMFRILDELRGGPGSAAAGT